MQDKTATQAEEPKKEDIPAQEAEKKEAEEPATADAQQPDAEKAEKKKNKKRNKRKKKKTQQDYNPLTSHLDLNATSFVPNAAPAKESTDKDAKDEPKGRKAGLSFNLDAPTFTPTA